ncbi:MAG: hypothetical protein QM647_16520 [Asticcacaulis sp.]|uniref:hypothetical protein n=1 Tax=Asticcacaulis sp. TaxID=1872648 RepID=UPI0039E4FBE3
MKPTLIKLTCLATVAACLTLSLTGCIMYVSPDHTYHSDKSPPPADERPADTVSGSQSF